MAKRKKKIDENERMGKKFLKNFILGAILMIVGFSLVEHGKRFEMLFQLGVFISTVSMAAMIYFDGKKKK